MTVLVVLYTMKQVRVAIVGLGVMGQRRAESVVNNKSAKLVVVGDVDRVRAESTGKKFSCEYSSDIEKVVTRDDIDAVIVSVPNKFHAAVSIPALLKGKHVFCEKPMASTPEEARKMVDSAKSSGSFLKVGSNHRFFPNVLKAREIVESGAIGKPLVFRGWIGHDGSKFGAEWFKNYDMVGGGTLLDNGCHVLDISRMLLGEADSCIAEVDNLAKQDIKPAEDYASAIYRTKHKGVININCSWIEWYGYLYFEVYGDQGFLIADARYGNKLVWGKKGDDVVQTIDFTNKPQQSYRLEMDHFIDSILNNKQPQPSGFDGMRVVEMIHAAYSSAKGGRRVTL